MVLVEQVVLEMANAELGKETCEQRRRLWG